MIRQKLVVDSDMFQRICYMFDLYYESEKDRWDYDGQITDKRHNEERRKYLVEEMFESAQELERVRRFIVGADIKYENAKDETISIAYDNGARDTLLYCAPVRDAWWIAKEGGLGDYYKGLLEGGKDGE